MRTNLLNPSPSSTRCSALFPHSPSPWLATLFPLPLPPLSNYHNLSRFVTVLTPLCSSHPPLFPPHLPALMQFLLAIILPAVDCGPTPTVKRSYPVPFGFGSDGSSSPSTSPPPPQDEMYGGAEHEREDRQTLRSSTLKPMFSLSEAKPSMVNKQAG